MPEQNIFLRSTYSRKAPRTDETEGLQHVCHVTAGNQKQTFSISYVPGGAYEMLETTHMSNRS